MFEELVTNLRNCAEINSLSYYKSGLMKQAADAIENLDDICQHQADEIRELKNQWIPVTERLPDGDGKYFCTVRSFSQYNNKQYRFVDILVFQDGCFFECGIGTERVTHWMPLPEPPKEET